MFYMFVTCLFTNDVNYIFNYICNDALIANFECLTTECKWQVILTDRGYNFNMWVPLGYTMIASRMFNL